MKSFVVLGTGQSLTASQVEYVREMRNTGHCGAVAVSDAYKLAPWADALVSQDASWWRCHPDAIRFSGRRFCGSAHPSTERIPQDYGLGTGLNSGLQGMRVAASLGAQRILLLGFDMHGTHYFGRHPEPLRNTSPKRFKDHIAQFQRWRGCQVINCTPRSELKQFPMSDIQSELGPMTEENKDWLISPRHVELNRSMHEAPRGFGHSGWKHAKAVIRWARELRCGSILDYGCGAGTLAAALIEQGWKDPIRQYDPAVPGVSALPEPADLVVCTDVLEHVEPERLDGVLNHIQSLARRGAFFCIATTLAHKLLPDGRNAHLIVESPYWWTERISREWTIVKRKGRVTDADGYVEVRFWAAKRR